MRPGHNPPPNPDEDLFDAWLDAMVTGQSTPVSGAPAGSPSVHPFDRVTSAASQFHGLAHAADAAQPRALRRPPLEKHMHRSLPASAPVVARPSFAWPKPDSRPVVTFQAWASYALVAIVVAGLTLGIGRATDFFEMSTPPPVEETTIPFSGLVDGDATPVPMGESSSFPYPNELNCTIEPLTRDEVVAHLEAANVATEPVYQTYAQPIAPSDEDAQAIMETYRMSQACGLSGRPLAYNLSLETPWYTANTSGAFWNAEQGAMVRPVSDERIQEFADIAVLSEDELNLIYPPPTPSQAEIDAWATEKANYSTPVYLPLPDDATPIAQPAGRNWPTIFPENIRIMAPDRAVVDVVFVSEFTGEVSNVPITIRYGFAKVDGVWLIDSYEEDSPEWMA